MCRRARNGEYAIVVDGCLMVAAGDASSIRRAMLAEADARLFALNAFGVPEMAKESPEMIAGAMDKVTLTDWLDGLGAISLRPLCLRPLSTRTFLDLAFSAVFVYYSSSIHPDSSNSFRKPVLKRSSLAERRQTACAPLKACEQAIYPRCTKVAR